ncbi:MAG: tetratricopeptide repeat protein, partial [Victivallales bacterium]|nr:tetratricopeptide repeat protein [Victivallales bacterium]
MEQRKWAEMEDFITRANTLSPSNAQDFQLQYRLAEAQIALQKYPEALRTITAVSAPQDNSKDKLRYDLIKVRVLALLNQVDKALEEYTGAKLASTVPLAEYQQQMWQMYVALADSLYTAKRFDDALPIYQRAIDRADGDAQKKHSMEYIIRIYVEKKYNKDSLIKALEQFGKTFPSSKEEIELTELYAQSLYNEKNYYEAIERFEKLCTLNPPQEKLYAAYMNIGKCCKFQGNINGSVEAFEKAEAYGKDETERAEALFQAADVASDFYHKSRRTESDAGKLLPYATTAITIFKRLATLFPNVDNAPLAIFKEATILYLLDDYKKAEAEYAIITGSYQTSEKYEEALLMQGMCMRRYASSPEQKLAANQFLVNGAAKMTPNSLFIDWANLEAAQAAEEAGNTKLAESLFDIVAQKGTGEKNKEALFNLAMLQFKTASDQEARKNADDFFAKYPTDPLFDELCLMTGDSYANESNWDMAAKYYIMPLTVTPIRNPRVTPYALYESANAAYHLEKYPEALNHLGTLIAAKDTVHESNLLARALFLRGEVLAKLLDY